MIIPGVQKPHCSPCSSQKPACSACSWPSGARPSMVVMFDPSACTANSVQDFALRPSTRTVQAPHFVVSQPMCVPVRRRCSRRKWTSRTRGSTCPLRALPLTVIETWAIGVSFARRKRALDYSKRLALLRLESPRVNSVVPDLVVDDALGGVEQPRRLRAVAPRRLQRILNQVLLVGAYG